MKRLFPLLLILSVLSFSSCRVRTGSGNIITAGRTVGSFTGIRAAQGFDVELVRGTETSVRLEVDDNLMDDVQVEVKDDVLSIRFKKSNMSIGDATLKAYVTAPEIRSIETSSAAIIRTKDMFSSESAIKLKASSGSTIEAELNAPDVSCRSSSGSTIIARGRTRNVEAEASSGSSIKAFGLLSEKARGVSSSGSQTELFASVGIDARASSGGAVYYKGGAAEVKRSESSGGAVTRKD